MKLNKKQSDLCEQSKWDFSDIKAIFLNCKLKTSQDL